MTVPLYQLSDVWADPTALFTAIQMNVQDGGHKEPGSLLFDLRVNGISQFNIDPSGVVLLMPDIRLFRDFDAGFAQRNAAVPQGFRVYNTYTDDTDWERGLIGWITTSNTFTVGAQATGTGLLHPMQFVGSNFLIAQADLGLYRVAPGVLGINTGSPGVHTACYLQWGGQARVIADASFANTTTLGNIAGLVVNVAAGRTYSFEAELSITDAAAGGIRCAIGGSCTATAIIYDGWIVDSGTNGIKGNTQATALGGVVASGATTGVAGHVTIQGTITVNAAGTLTVQASQFAANATATVIKRGSRFIVHDMP